MANDLAEILRRSYLTGKESTMLVRQQDGRLLLWFSAVSTGELGTLLATLSRPGELSDRESLSCRIAVPWDGRSSAHQWKYEMTTTRFADGSILFVTKVLVPFGDLPEVLARLGP